MIAQTAKAPALGGGLDPAARILNGYRVLSHLATVSFQGTGEQIGQVIVQYARGVSDTEATVKRVELLLLLGVLIGTGMALLAGMMIARRAMAPIARLTSSAEEIARTRDPSRVMPQSEADDEVSELARTLQGMLRELDAARGETEAMLVRQRRFVADASHELRTPLTSVLVNLELLAESLHGDQGEAARSALRSSQRMRRLVADLLLLARTDVGRVIPHEPCALDQIVVEAASELGPVSAAHEISLDVGRAGPLLPVMAPATNCTASRSTFWRTRCATPPPAPRSVSRAASAMAVKPCWSSKTTAPVCPPSWHLRDAGPRSQQLCPWRRAATAQSAAHSASASRSFAPSPTPTAARSRSNRRGRVTALHTARRFIVTCRRRPSMTTRVHPPPQRPLTKPPSIPRAPSAEALQLTHSNR